MSINIKSIPNYQEIYEYVPQSQYTRNAVTSARRITKLNSEQALTGKFQPNLEAVFRISPSTSSLLNLAECYFSVTGRMQRPCVTNETLIPALKCGSLWLLRCLNKITLEIGGTAVESIQTPALLAKLYEQLAVNYNDKQNGTLIDDGFYPSTGENNFFNSMNFNPTNSYSTSQNGSDTEYVAVLGNPDFIENAPNCLYNDINQKYKAKGKAKNIVFAGISPTNNLSVTTAIPAGNANIASGNSWTWMFKQNLKLKDVFTCVEHLKPVYGQSVVVRLQFDSDGYTSIIDSFGGSPVIYNFEQFYLNVYQYVINVDMINKLNQIYSKPVVEIIDCMDKQIQSVPSMGEGNLCQIFIPLSLQFETEFIAIALPNCISNNANNGLILGQAVPNLLGTGQEENPFVEGANKQVGGIMQNVTWKNFTEHTPADYKFINIERISIEGDGEILYDRTFKENSYPAGFPFSLYNSPYQSLVTDLNITTGADITGYKLTKVQTAPFNDYTNAYELYKQSRCYYDITEESATPFVEWLYSGFALIIPTSCFSRLTSGTQISIQILFGPGVATESHYSNLTNLPQFANTQNTEFKIGMNERINQVTATQFRTEVLKQIMVVQKYRRALVYNGFNSTSLKQITQNFEQDIEVNESNDNVTTAN